METKTYFFDTYAIFEIIKGSVNYAQYLFDIGVITTSLNLMELYYGLLIKHGKPAAERYYNSLLDFTIPINDDIIKKACEFRSENKNKKLSYIDCIGYIIAVEKNVKFLTGDEQFKGMLNVEFVK